MYELQPCYCCFTRYIFIADTGNHRIREIVGGPGGIIQTVAGNGTPGFAGDGGAATSAELFYPYGVFVDGSESILIADTGNNRIRQMAPGTGIIATVAGNGSSLPEQLQHEL